MKDTAPTPSHETSSVRASAGRRRQRVLRYVLAFVTVVLVIDAVVGEKGLLALLDAGRDYQTLEQALRHVRTENANLRVEARRLREDPAAIEELARRELGMIKPGETLFIIRDVSPKKP